VFALSNVMWPVHPSEAYLRFVWGISSEGPPFSNVSHSQRHEKDESSNESKAQSGSDGTIHIPVTNTILLRVCFHPALSPLSGYSKFERRKAKQLDIYGGFSYALDRQNCSILRIPLIHFGQFQFAALHTAGSVVQHQRSVKRESTRS
jgi:hypothetical protein